MPRFGVRKEEALGGKENKGERQRSKPEKSGLREKRHDEKETAEGGAPRR